MTAEAEAEVDAEIKTETMPKRTSEILVEFARETEGDVTIGDLLDALRVAGPIHSDRVLL